MTQGTQEDIARFNERTFLTSMVETYRCLVLKCAGVKSTIVDGETVMLTDLEAKLDFYDRKLKAISGYAPRVSQIDMSGC